MSVYSSYPVKCKHRYIPTLALNVQGIQTQGKLDILDLNVNVEIGFRIFIKNGFYQISEELNIFIHLLGRSKQNAFPLMFSYPVYLLSCYICYAYICINKSIGINIREIQLEYSKLIKDKIKISFLFINLFILINLNDNKSNGNLPHFFSL